MLYFVYCCGKKIYFSDFTMQDNSQLTIQTPENITFGYELADLGSRFQACVIDTILIVISQFIVIAIVLAVGNAADLFGAVGWVIGIAVVLMFLLLWGYYILFELIWNGQTPGKRYIGLRVVDRQGVPVTFAASIIRNLVRIIDLLPVAYGLGTIVMAINKRGLRLGDLAAGTLVVRDKTLSLDQLTQMPTLNLGTVEAIDLPLYRLSEADVALAYDYLARRKELKTQRKLLRPILQHLYDQMEVELEEQLLYRTGIARLEWIVQTRHEKDASFH